MANFFSNAKNDPRWFQIAILTCLLVFQQLTSQFAQNIWLALSLVVFSFSFEKLLNHFFTEQKSWPSSVISGLSLSLLFRAHNPVLMFAAIIMAIASKRIIRYRGQHIFNPVNLAIIVMLIIQPYEVWVASGVWDKGWLTIAFISLLGIIVTRKSQRLDISLAFLISYLGLHGLRLVWLDDPFSLLAFRFNNLAMIIFCFFMISDPKTTPVNQVARLIFAFLIASLAFTVDAVLFERNGLFWALVIASPTVILFNYFFKGERYSWPEKI